MSSPVSFIRILPQPVGVFVEGGIMSDSGEEALREVLSAGPDDQLRALACAGFAIIGLANKAEVPCTMNLGPGMEVVLRGPTILLMLKRDGKNLADLFPVQLEVKEASLDIVTQGLSKGSPEEGGVELRKWKYGEDFHVLPKDNPFNRTGFEQFVEDLIAGLARSASVSGDSAFVGPRAFDIYALEKLPADCDVPKGYRRMLEVPAFAATERDFASPACVVLSCLSFYIELLKTARNLKDVPEDQAVKFMDEASKLVDLIGKELDSSRNEWPVTADQWKVG